MHKIDVVYCKENKPLLLLLVQRRGSRIYALLEIQNVENKSASIVKQKTLRLHTKTEQLVETS